MNVIEVDNITKDFGNKKGIFNISFSVSKGETIGFLGPNGAGKTTTIRHLMGFIRPQSGHAFINGFDCFRNRQQIFGSVGYLPGEMAFPRGMKASELINTVKHIRKSSEKNQADTLLGKFGLEKNLSVDTMSLGEKRKLGIVLAFMDDPDILILDEPTNGLDPLSQKVFYDLIKEKQESKKTILLSSHRFEEVELLCQKIILIKDGIIVNQENIENIKNYNKRTYAITFLNKDEASAFSDLMETATLAGNRAEITTDDINLLIKTLSGFNIQKLEEKQTKLDDYFMMYYGGEKND